MKNKNRESRWKEILVKTIGSIIILSIVIVGWGLIYKEFKEDKSSKRSSNKDKEVAKIMEKFSADINEEQEQLLNPLRGIDKLIVLVEVLNEEAINLGLKRHKLENLIKTKLRKRSIIILDKMDPFTPKIYLNVHVTEQAFSIYMAILEDVSLSRDPSITCDAFTWHNGITGSHGYDPGFVVSNLSQLLDKFINDYYKANPKK